MKIELENLLILVKSGDNQDELILQLVQGIFGVEWVNEFIKLLIEGIQEYTDTPYTNQEDYLTDLDSIRRLRRMKLIVLTYK